MLSKLKLILIGCTLNFSPVALAQVCNYAGGPSPSPEPAQQPIPPHAVGCQPPDTLTGDFWIPVDNSCDLIGMLYVGPNSPRNFVFYQNGHSMPFGSGFAITASGHHFNGYTLVCAQSISAQCGGKGTVVCSAVADGATSAGPAKLLGAVGPKEPWFKDFGPNGFIASMTSGPLHNTSDDGSDGYEAFSSAVCSYYQWLPSNNTWSTTPYQGCTPQTLDGQPCTGMCFMGTGSIKNGSCDISGLAPVCAAGQTCDASGATPTCR